MRYPTVSPTASPSCFAMKVAAARAATRRGSSINIFLSPRQAAFNNAIGTCVVLPFASVLLRLFTTTAAFSRFTLPLALRVMRFGATDVH